MIAVGACNVEPHTHPSVSLCLSRIYGDPICAAVGRAHGSAQVCPVADVGVLVSHRERQRILSPIRPKPFGDPGVVNIGARFCSGTAVFFPNQDPSSPGVCRLSDTKPFHSTFFQVLVGDISRIGVMETRCEGPQLCISRPQIHFPPGCAFVVGHKCRLITNRINDRLSVLSEARGDIRDCVYRRRGNLLQTRRRFRRNKMRAGHE